MPLTISPKMWWLCINLTKYVQDLCVENYEIWLKEIFKNLNKFSPILPIDSLQLQSKSQQAFKNIYQQLILTPTQKGKGTRIVKTTLKKNNIGELILPKFKTYCVTTVVKKVWNW